jgi:hypothetical protein
MIFNVSFLTKFTILWVSQTVRMASKSRMTDEQQLEKYLYGSGRGLLEIGGTEGNNEAPQSG